MKRYLLLNSLKFGGAEKVAQILANAEIFAGVILLEKDSDYQLKVPVYTLTSHSFKTNSAFKTLFIPFYAYRLRRFVSRGDIVVSFAERANFVNIFSKFFWHNKAVLTLHTNIDACFRNYYKFIYYFLIKLLYPRADKLVSVSDGINQRAAKIVKDPVRRVLIYNPIDQDDIKEKAKEPMDFSLDFSNTLILVGRLSEEKRQWIALRVFKEVLAVNPQAKLLIVGDGPLREKLLSYANRLGLKVFSAFSEQTKLSNEFSVYFFGYQKNPYQFIARSTVLMLSSLFEGFPVSILEALACGVPVVSIDCNYGPREILASTERPCGILIPMFKDEFSLDNLESKEEEKQWAKSIIELLANQEKKEQLISRGHERIADFSIAKIKNDWENLFISLN